MSINIELDILKAYFEGIPIQVICDKNGITNSAVISLLSYYDISEIIRSCTCLSTENQNIDFIDKIRWGDISSITDNETITDDAIIIGVADYGLEPYERIVEHECLSADTIAVALTILGRIYHGVLDRCGDLFELVVPSDRKAAGFYLQAARTGNEEAMFRLGGLLYESGDRLFPIDLKEIGIDWLGKVSYGPKRGENIDEKLRNIHRFYDYGIILNQSSEFNCARELFKGALANHKNALRCLKIAAKDTNNLDAKYWLARYNEELLRTSAAITYAEVMALFMDNAVQGHKESEESIRAEGLERELKIRQKYRDRDGI